MKGSLLSEAANVSLIVVILMQEFIDSLLDECAKVGISEIGQSVPETAWHGGGQSTVEDTLRTAVQYGQETFGQKPRIIFILLPGNGEHPAVFAELQHA